MKNIAIFCVNYNTYKELHDYIKSVDIASSSVGQTMNVDMFIADNTEVNILPICGEMEYAHVRVFNFNTNLGYLGAVSRMMHLVDMNKYDYFIISNVDVLMEPNTLKKLLEVTDTESVGWIAPQIYSIVEKRDRNPNITSRYSKKKLELLRLLYEYPFLNALYTRTFYKRKRIHQNKSKQTYAGHGSFIILTKEYYRRCGIIEYPVFLYGEEIYLGEMCRREHLRVIYEPQIIVKDKEHASTKSMNNKFYYRCNKEALDFLIAEFY